LDLLARRTVPFSSLKESFAVFLAVLTTALFTVDWSIHAITPDLLMGGLLLLALSKTIETSSNAAIAGFFYGLAYLAKAVALPISVGLNCRCPCLHDWPTCQVRNQGRWLEFFLGAALVALPWILLLSLHYGTPTFSTAGSINHAIVAPGGPVPNWFIRSFHVPSPGRLLRISEIAQFGLVWEGPSPARQFFCGGLSITYLTFSQRLSPRAAQRLGSTTAAQACRH
jgi:hypothetical protein